MYNGTNCDNTRRNAAILRIAKSLGLDHPEGVEATDELQELGVTLSAEFWRVVTEHVNAREAAWADAEEDAAYDLLVMTGQASGPTI